MLLAGTGVLVLFALVMVLRPFPASVGQPLAYAVQTATALAVGVALVRRGRAATGGLRRARLLIAAALACGALGGALSLAVHVATGEPAAVPSLPDVVHFGFLPLGVLGLLAYPTRDTEPGSALRSLLDGAVAALALWFLAYALLLEPADVGGGLRLLETLTVLAYPTADVFLLGALVGVLPRVAPLARRELALTGGGFALYCAADVAYTVQSTTGTYRADSWVSVVAQAALLLMLLGATAPAAEGERLRSLHRLALLPQVPVVLAVALATAHGLGRPGREGVLHTAGGAVVVALLLRQAAGSRDRRDLTGRLRSREELFRSLVTGGSDLITLTDAAGTVLWASPAVERTVGRTALRGESLLDSVHPDDRAVLAAAAASARASAQAEALCRLRSTTGWRWMQVRLQDRLDDPAVGGLICNARDVHERHLLERQLSHAAYTDALTGLGNLARGRVLLARCCAGSRAGGVLLVDLDGFKAVNDTYGHAYGDALLGLVAGRLLQCLPPGDEVVRLGGDEFVLVVEDVRAAPAVAQRVLDALRVPLEVSGLPLTVSASIGLAGAADACSPDELLRNADLAMYASKAAGRDQVTAYAPSMHLRAAHRMQVHRGLRQALDQDLLALHYQPIVRLSDGVLVGAEALLRWEDPEHATRVETAEAIEVAEESGIIAEVDLWVLERACRDIAAWRAAGLVVPRLSINVSRRQMTAGLPVLVEQALARHGLPGSCLCLEVTESAVVADADVASAALSRVRALGVTVALDDFGTGQSSLSQLARLPVDNVKIDMGFTQSATHDLGARRLLVAVLQVCQSLSLPVVAEGIEDRALAGLLEGAGCQLGQGWHFGRPQAGARFAGLLAAGALPAPREPVADRTLQP